MGQHPSRSNDPEESQRLIGSQDGLEETEEDGYFAPRGVDSDRCPINQFKHLPVYTTIHRIRRYIIAAVDDPYSLEQLRDPRMNVHVVRPLVDKIYEMDDVSTVYCLLVNRTQFQRELSVPHQTSISTTRALLCELVANRVLRRFSEDHHGPEGLLLLSQILVGGFDPFQGAPDSVSHEQDALSWAMKFRTGTNRRLPALEIAIISESKTFLSSSACRNVVSAIYEGRVVYTPTAFMDILPDHYKNKPISLYDPRQAPILNQYRLIVPRTRNVMELLHFVILLCLYCIVMSDRDPAKFAWREVVFILYTLGWVLDQTASMLEHGWRVYTQNLWSFLDVTFSCIFGVYLVLRIHGYRTDQLVPAQQALDVLAVAAPVLIPRLAFNVLSENMLFISLRDMMRDFTVLTLLAVWCFAGFFLSLFWLAEGRHGPITISKWMLWIWFGLDGTGITTSTEFHWLLGPILMIAFAFLGNTLFLTILVSMLSTTFSTIVSNATAEIQFRRAVLTLEGVKSDSLFAYFPPFNLLALFVLMPLKFVLTPRWFHKINVAAVRILNAPLLLSIGYFERRALWADRQLQIPAEQLPKTSRAGLWDFSRSFSVHGTIKAVFDAEPPEETRQEIDREEEELTTSLRRGSSLIRSASREISQNRSDNRQSRHAMNSTEGSEAGGSKNVNKKRVRRDSVAPFAGITIPKHLRDLLNDGSDDEDEGSVKNRLGKLEDSMRRIETLLGRLADEREEETLTGESEIGRAMARTGTMADLDTSRTEELEDVIDLRGV